MYESIYIYRRGEHTHTHVKKREREREEEERLRCFRNYVDLKNLKKYYSYDKYYTQYKNI